MVDIPKRRLGRVTSTRGDGVISCLFECIPPISNNNTLHSRTINYATANGIYFQIKIPRFIYILADHIIFLDEHMN